METNIAIYPLGDQAVTFSLGNHIEQNHHRKIMAMQQILNKNPFPGLLDIVVAYSTITITYDLYTLRSATKMPEAFAFVRDKLLDAYYNTDALPPTTQKLWQVPVCYERPFAPDLAFIAEQRGISKDKVIALHTSRVYHIYMIGFLPGFPYMAEVDPQIAIPRKEKPRPKVEAGSVGIAGIQTGIYPVTSPGGWQIIGKTPLTLFDKKTSPPSKFTSGDTVQFYAITEKEYHEFTSAH